MVDKEVQQYFYKAVYRVHQTLRPVPQVGEVVEAVHRMCAPSAVLVCFGAMFTPLCFAPTHGKAVAYPSQSPPLARRTLQAWCGI